MPGCEPATGRGPGWWPNARAGDRISLTLKRTGALAGVVRDLSGAPIAGAVVRAVVRGPRQAAFARTDDEVRSRSVE
jgi:hypothetical protein